MTRERRQLIKSVSKIIVSIIDISLLLISVRFSEREIPKESREFDSIYYLRIRGQYLFIAVIIVHWKNVIGR